MEAVSQIKMCGQHDCKLQASVRISWPGRGWVYYCLTDAQRGYGILKFLGSEGAIEHSPLGWDVEGTRITSVVEAL